MKKGKILITGSAGFVGYHLSEKLCRANWEVIGIDNLNSYYDVNLKESRLSLLKSFSNFQFHKIDLVDKKELDNLFGEQNFEFIVHLAAQAGVRYSIENPYAYIDSNITGFMNILEACRNNPVKHLMYASSSSVYGANKKIPFSINDTVDHPVSLYAATKKSNELMAHTYSSLYDIPTTGLRFFTVYGPWGRPDMAYFSFTKAILDKKPINVFNNGNLERDFTYIDDIVESLTRLIFKPPESDSEWDGLTPVPSKSFAPYNLFNIGNNQPVKLLDFISTLENILNVKAVKKLLPMQPGDVYKTYADIDELSKYVEYRPNTNIKVGLSEFINWYKKYYKVN